MNPELLREGFSNGFHFDGQALVKFEDPGGFLSGTAAVDFSSTGDAVVRIEVESGELDPAYRHMLHLFLEAREITKLPDRTVYSLSGKERRISSVRIDTDIGYFSGSSGFVSDGSFGTANSIELTLNDLVLHKQPAGIERYWLLPLRGPLSKYATREQGDPHPLVFPQVGYFSFSHEDRGCGVQPIPESLGQTLSFNGYTALAFGEIRATELSTDELILSIPTEIVNALAFSVGSDVTCPWIETRDSNGHLVRRVFIDLGRFRTIDGSETFSHLDSLRPGSGMGAFLRVFFSLPEHSRDRLIGPMNLVRSGTPGAFHIEDSITDLVKALDTLCDAENLARQNLITLLTDKNAEAVRRIVDSARSGLKELRKLNAQAGNLDQLSIIDRVISRQSTIATDDRDFGIAVTSLMKQFDLHDSEVLNEQFKHEGLSQTWEGLLSAVRGEVIHKGHIRISNRDQLRSWFEFARHLHDICKRLILKATGYSGTYMPSNVMWAGQYKTGRVLPTMAASNLGYTRVPRSV